VLNEFFTAVEAEIRAAQGVVMRFQGDAILAAFNLPKGNTDHAACALRAALAIQTAVKTQRFGRNAVSLAVRIGVNTGEGLAAAVGSDERADYTIHGDAVNLAARLEQLNKQHGTRVIASQRTVELAGEAFEATALGEVSIRGMALSVRIFRLG
jgi:adenylate cyclase